MDLIGYEVRPSRHFILTWMRKWDWDIYSLRKAIENADKIEKVGKYKYEAYTKTKGKSRKFIFILDQEKKEIERMIKNTKEKMYSTLVLKSNEIRKKSDLQLKEREKSMRIALEKEYKETILINDGIKLCLRALKKVLGNEFDIKRVDGGFIKTSEKKFVRLDQATLKKSMA